MTTNTLTCAHSRGLFSQRAAEIHEAVSRVVDSGSFVLGPEVQALEQEFSLWLNKPVTGAITPPRTLGVTSGSEALELALRGFFSLNADVAPANQGGHSDGTAVFAPSHTNTGTVIAIERAGAVPVLVDIDPLTMTMSPSSLADAVDAARNADLTPAAVIAVHAHGHPCHMRLLELVSQDAGLWILEDCSQAHGALYHERTVGTLAEAAAFSCSPWRILPSLGDAGLVCTGFAPLAEEMEILRQLGRPSDTIATLPGVNARMADVQAAVLRVHLRHIDQDLTRRRDMAARYNEALEDSKVAVPQTASWARHVYGHYVVRVPSMRHGAARRDDLLRHLQAQGIEVMPPPPHPLHLQPAYKNRVLTAPDHLPETLALYDQMLALPLYPTMSEDEQGRIIEAVLTWQG